MKTIKGQTETVKSTLEEKRYKARLGYYENKLGLPHEEAERRAGGGDKQSAPADPTNGEQPLTSWQRRQAKKKAGQVQPLETDRCPQCGCEFLCRMPEDSEAAPESVKLPACPKCKIRFYFAQ